jgi:DNA-binding LacI/PurR family transcriptional regulator
METLYMATRADVAKLAGVSASTVSYALSGDRSIKEETRARVLQAVAQLNYRPNFAAGALAGGKSKTLALLSPSGEFGIALITLEYINGASAAAHDRGYHLVIWPSQESEMSEIQTFAESGMISGVILMEIKFKDERVDYLKKAKVPFTMIGRTEKPANDSFVDRDFITATQLGIDYLVSLGHKNIAFLTTDRAIGVDTRFSAALIDAAKKKKMTVKRLQVVNEASSGREAFIELHKKFPEVTAVVSLNDIATLGFISGANEYGVKIPKDLSLIALDTPENHIEMSWPPLTTVGLPAYEMGRAASNILIDQIEGKASKENQTLLAGELVIRGTTAKARSPKKSD